MIGSAFEEGAEARRELVERAGFERKPRIHGLAADLQREGDIGEA